MKSFLLVLFIITAPILLFSQTKQITYGDAQDYHPRWSPDQSLILYTSRDLSNQPTLKLFDIKNGSTIDINTGKQGDHYSNWIPGTKRILFDCLDESGRPSIWEFDYENMQTRMIYGNQVCFHPFPSPDGEKIVFTSIKTDNPEIFIFDLKTEEIEQITFNKTTDHHPVWSPGAQKIIFESYSSGNFDIYEYYLDEKITKPFITTSEFDGHVCLSPDGKYLAYSHGPVGERNILIRNIYNEKELSITYEDDNSWPDWSIDNLIVFVSNREGNMNLYMLDVSELLKKIE
jgi:TolB protein